MADVFLNQTSEKEPNGARAHVAMLCRLKRSARRLNHQHLLQGTVSSSYSSTYCPYHLVSYIRILVPIYHHLYVYLQ